MIGYLHMSFSCRSKEAGTIGSLGFLVLFFKVFQFNARLIPALASRTGFSACQPLTSIATKQNLHRRKPVLLEPIARSTQTEMHGNAILKEKQLAIYWPDENGPLRAC
jgi:hypothetical protein